MRVNFYIDSFNLYYGCLKGTPYKWLDIGALCAALQPQHQLGRIKFFTARVQSRPNDPNQAVRQQTYFRALETIPDFTIHYGQFTRHEVRMPLAHPVVPGPQYADVIKTEEKGSDVSLATHMLVDGFKKDYELAVVISGDTDLLEPIIEVKRSLGLRAGVINPHARPSSQLKQAAWFYHQLDTTLLPVCQFPVTMTDSVGTFTKPASW